MGISYRIDAAARIVRLVYRDPITIDDFTGTLEAVFRDRAYRPGFGILADRRHAEPATPEYLRGAINFELRNEQKLKGARWAVVVSTRSSSAAVKLGAQLAERALLPQCVEVFDDVESATDWLRLTAGKQ